MNVLIKWRTRKRQHYSREGMLKNRHPKLKSIQGSAIKRDDLYSNLNSLVFSLGIYQLMKWWWNIMDILVWHNLYGTSCLLTILLFVYRKGRRQNYYYAIIFENFFPTELDLLLHLGMLGFRATRTIRQTFSLVEGMTTNESLLQIITKEWIH